MNKTKTQNGITLVALIVTIIILLILAVVALNAADDGALLKHAENSVDTYKEGREKEDLILGNYAEILSHYNVIPPPPPGEKAITITPTTLTLRVGGEAGTVTATLPEGETGTITYTSSDTDIATVNTSGVVTPVAAGSATITASCEGFTSATCTVTIGGSESEVVSIEGNYGNVTNDRYVQYYMFNEGTVEEGIQSGTGARVEPDKKNELVQKQEAFNYTVTADNIVTLNYSNGDTETYTYIVKKDSNGKVANRAIEFTMPLTWPYDSAYKGQTVTYRTIYTDARNSWF